MKPNDLASVRRRLLETAPARTDRVPEPPADTRPRFERGVLAGRLVDQHERFIEEVAPDLVLTAAAAGDFDANRILEARKAEFDKWTDESVRRERLAAPAVAAAKERERFALLGFEVPPGETVQAYYEAHKPEIDRSLRVSMLKAQAAELERKAATEEL